MNRRNVEASAPATLTATWPDDGLSAFLCARPRLFGLARRMLGNVADAEDLVQDVWVRWQITDQSRVRNPLAFLVVAARRLAINVLQSARARRETCVGTWLPETADLSLGPGLEAEQGEALDLAVRVLVEKLQPTECAAYVLRQAFDYPYRAIADTLHVEEANARQLVSRARDHMSGERRSPAPCPTQRRRLLDAFVAAAGTGDLAALERLFASIIGSTSSVRRGVVTMRHGIRSMAHGPRSLQTRNNRRSTSKGHRS